MSSATVIARSAPIPIAAKPRRSPANLAENCEAKRKASLGGRTSDSPIRGRKDRPCDACRRRKSKCVMQAGKPSCALCHFHSQDCTFVESPQPRKRKLNAESKDDSVGKRRSPDRAAEEKPQRQDTGTSSSSFDENHSLTEDLANIGGPTLMKRTLGLQNDRYSQYIGPTTDFEPSLIDLSPFDPQDESLLSRGTLRKVSERDTFLMLPDYNTPGHEHEIQDSDAIESIVAPHGPALIDLYFYIIHPNFPILQKNVFLEKYNISHRELSPPLLAAVYILAINWWDHSELLTHYARPNLRELERLARTTLADVMYRPKLSTIQAGLLLSQRPEGDQWAPTAQLVAVSQELGLHLDCSHWKIPLWERSLRKRLAWALYMQDKWGSLVHGRPSHIFANNWAVQPLTTHDFPDGEFEASAEDEADEYDRGRQLFMQMIVLSQILAEVLETFYTLGAMDQVARSGASGTHLVLSLAKPVQLKLKDWYAALPAALKMDTAASTASNSKAGSAEGNRPKVSSTGYLHLAYFATEITIHRRIVRSLAGSGSHDPSRPAVDPYIQHICRSAAKTRLISAMDFVNRLTPSHLRAFWYFASKTNFALIGTFGSLLWATAPGREEADFYRARLAEFRWTLGVSSGRHSIGHADRDLKGVHGLTEFAIGMLDTSTGLLLNALPEKPVLASSSRRGSELGFSAAPQGVPSASSTLEHLAIPSYAPSYTPYSFNIGVGIGSGGSAAGGAHEGLASPATSTSSGFDAYMAEHPAGSTAMELGYGD